jgi:polysaccharide biosynthesis/export protein
MFGAKRRLAVATLCVSMPVWSAVAQPVDAVVPRSVPITDPNSILVQAATPYRINPGDELAVYVWGEERLQRQVRVLPDGSFAFPLIGHIMAQGRLPQDIEAIITDRLKDQYRGQVPQVTVSVTTPAGMQFSVMGRVKSPGSFSPGRYINVLEALSMAGGPSEFANLDNVLILRKAGDRLLTIRARLSPLFKSGANGGDVARANIARLESGDTVIVP